MEVQHLIHGGFIKVAAGNDITHVPFFGSLGNQKDLPIFDRAVSNIQFFFSFLIIIING